MSGPLARETPPYLPPSAARGCRYCLNPGSPLLRLALTRRRPDEIDREALSEDIDFFHRLLQQQYAGYP